MIDFKPDYQGQIDMFIHKAMIKHYKEKLNDDLYVSLAVEELAEMFI